MLGGAYMFSDFVTFFFGSNYEPNDFELTFALFVCLLFMYGLSEIISAIAKFIKG